MPEFATVDDVAARYEDTIGDGERDRVTTLLDDAETLVAEQVPALAARIADGRVTAETVRRVVCGMVLDVLRNPSGYTAQTAGEFSVSFQGSPSAAGGRLRLSADDKAALKGRARARTVPMDDPALSRLLRPSTET